jgi:HD-GYP domain-containing protein (c-di-GMP phosphodiesterase class II)
MENKTRTVVLIIGVTGALTGAGGLLFDSLGFAWLGLIVCAFSVTHALLTRANPTAPLDESSGTEPTRPRSVIGRPQVSAPTSVEPFDVMSALGTAAGCAGNVASTHLWIVDEPSQTVRLVVAAGTQCPSADPVSIKDGVFGGVVARGSAVLEREAAVSVDGEQFIMWRYAVPIQAGEVKGIAAIDIIGDEPDRTSLTEVVSMLRASLSGSLALHVARLESAAARTLLETAGDLARLVDEQSVVDLMLSRALVLAGAQTGSVMLLGEDGFLSICAAHGLPADVVESTSIGAGEGIAGWVLATRKSMVVEDLHDSGVRGRRHGIRSAMAVPIGDDDGILGVLNVGSRVFHARFASSQKTALEALGRIGVVALRNAKALEASRTLYFDTLRALSLALETKDPYSRGATQRVLDLATTLGVEMRLDEREQTALRVAALLHDVGMAALGDAAKVENRPLTTVEWGMIQMHPVIASDVLAQAPALADAVPIVYHHHEHFDGQGYVLGLTGERIPIGARALAVADAYVALTSKRPYRSALSGAAALEEIRSKAGSQFDPEVVRALERALGETTAVPTGD